MGLRSIVIDRRTVLRGVLAGGATVAVPLPRLAGMMNENGTAYADASALPIRFGVWFFGNGIIPERWVPARTGQGAAWTLSEQLAPLQLVKPWISVVTGCTIKVPDTAAHATHPTAALSGANLGQGTFQLPSIDQAIGKITSTGATYPNGLHVKVSNTNGGTSLDTAISFSNPNQPNQPELSPTNLFKKLVQFANTGMPAMPDPELIRRNLVLDAVNADAKALRARLGMDDQARLDRHLDGIQQLQLQITRAAGPKLNQTLVDPDKTYANRGNDGAITRLRGQAFADLLVFALATDLTRTFSYTFTPPACHGSYADCGLDPNTFHGDFGHRGSMRGHVYATEGFNTGVRYAITNLADMLTRMKSTPDGTGNLLDNSCVYTTSCCSESMTHSNLDFPLLISGKAGGKLKGDQHLRFVDENASKVPYTLLSMMGSTAKSFGLAEGQVTSTIPELLA
jgi:Protein of unknown function (DUF1552)